VQHSADLRLVVDHEYGCVVHRFLDFCLAGIRDTNIALAAENGRDT
jgi:hypothetical protein